jgi:fido (protein-threonine AMPylation protein)
MSHDPYCYPGTTVLRNKFDIRDGQELKATEARVASIALFVFEDQPPIGPVNEDRLRAIHRAIFEELYEWAGTYRENIGTMTKGRDAGYEVTYGDSQFVAGEMHRIFVELQQEHFLRGLDPEEFAARLAYFYSEIDATHPFREGNSRTLRQFSTDLALTAGYELDWEPTGRTHESKNALYMARDSAFQRREYEKLIAIMRSNLTPLQP